MHKLLLTLHTDEIESAPGACGHPGLSCPPQTNKSLPCNISLPVVRMVEFGFCSTWCGLTLFFGYAFSSCSMHLSNILFLWLCPPPLTGRLLRCIPIFGITWHPDPIVHTEPCCCDVDLVRDGSKDLQLFLSARTAPQ